MTPFTGLTDRQKELDFIELFVDFESTFDSGQGLGFSKQTTEEYVRDPRFEVTCTSLLVGEEEDCNVLDPEETREFFAGVDWSRTIAIAHNAEFDIFVLTQTFGHSPGLIADTKSIARCLYPNLEGGYSLNALCRRFDLGEKRGSVLPYDGYDMAFFRAHPKAYEAYMRYAAGDVFLLRKLYRKLLSEGRFSTQEADATDAILRASTDPVLVVSEGRSEAYARKTAASYEEIKHLADDERFAEELRAHGVEPETKPTKTGAKYSFAKTDSFMVELSHNESEVVRNLHDRRLEANSAGERTRSRSLANIAKRGPMPSALIPYGAHTGRDSGGGGINLQNLAHESYIKKCIGVPKGYALVGADASQIECRVLNTIAGEDWVVDAFREGKDVYCESGFRLFDKRFSKTDDPEGLRHPSKVIELACGYGLGAGAPGRPGGLYARMVANKLPRSQQWCAEAVDRYRKSHPSVTRLWDDGHLYVTGMTDESQEWREGELGNLEVAIRKGRMRLPSGRELHFPNIRKEGRIHRYGRLHKTRLVDAKLPGYVLIQNLVQALARDITFYQEVGIRRAFPNARLALRIHDAIYFVVPEKDAEALLEHTLKALCQPPEWLPTVPLGSEGWIGRVLADMGDK